MYNNPQDRSAQPCRVGGGNTDAGQSEKHDQKKSSRIAQGGSVGKVVATTSPFECGGNASCGESTERHDQAKAQGKKSVGGKVVGAAPVVEKNIQVSERRHGAGNDPSGEHEADGQKKAKRLDLSTDRFDA